jgi:MscS family membrane protein
LDSIETLKKFFLADFPWMTQVFGIVLVTLLLAGFVRRFIIKVGKKTRNTENILDDALFDSLVGPSRGLVWVVGLSFAVQVVVDNSEVLTIDSVGMIRNLGIIGMLTWFLVRFVRIYENLFTESKIARGEQVDTTLVEGLGKLFRVTILITMSLIVLQTLGINVAGLLAFGGVGGIAVGLAAKDLMANVFGGFTIYIDRPFTVGDWIRSPDRDIEGVVEDIGWRRTAIRTFNKRLLYVPNAVFSTIALENPSRMSHRRINESFGVRYDDISVLPKILESVRAYLKQNPDLDQSQTMMVNLDEFAESSVNFFIYVFTKTTVWTEYHAVKETVLFEISKIIDAGGAEMAYPTRTIHTADNIFAEGIEAPEQGDS